MLSKVLISKEALLHNFRVYKKLSDPADVMCVIKSNAYGHGLTQVSSLLKKECHWFGVASADEALQLRQSGVKNNILVLSFYGSDQINDLIRSNVAFAVYSKFQIQQISKAAVKLRINARVHIKIDVGTTRIGFLPDDVESFLDEAVKLPGVKLEGIFSHFAASEEKSPYTKLQLNKFQQLVRLAENKGLKLTTHIACTAAATNYSESRADMVRLGIGLYGLWPSGFTQRQAEFELKPVLSWATCVVQVKTIPKGTFVGYGMSYEAKKNMQIAILPVGYFDGYDRKLSNNSHVLINNTSCPVIGRVCMNLCMVDVSGSKKQVVAGDEAILIGHQGKLEITADDLAKRIETINYEVVARINPLIKRLVV